MTPRVSFPLPLAVRVNPILRYCSIAWLMLKRPFLLRRVRRHVIERVEGVPIVVFPEVLNPAVFRSGAWLAHVLAGHRTGHSSAKMTRALDMGTGSGVGAIFAARCGYQVVAIDLNPEAVRCARVNVLMNGLEEQVQVRLGDLFVPVAGETFDLILFNPPFFRGTPKDLLDLAWRSVDVFERFAAGLPSALAPGGQAWIVLSTDGEAPALLHALEQSGLAVRVIARRNLGNEIMSVYCAEFA